MSRGFNGFSFWEWPACLISPNLSGRICYTTRCGWKYYRRTVQNIERVLISVSHWRTTVLQCILMYLKLPFMIYHMQQLTAYVFKELAKKTLQFITIHLFFAHLLHLDDVGYTVASVSVHCCSRTGVALPSPSRTQEAVTASRVPNRP